MKIFGWTENGMRVNRGKGEYVAAEAHRILSAENKKLKVDVEDSDKALDVYWKTSKTLTAENRRMDGLITLLNRQVAELSAEGRGVEDAAFRFLMHIQRQIEKQPGWMQFDYYHPEIDVCEYALLSKALGSESHAKSSELLERYSASTRRGSAVHACKHCGKENMILADAEAHEKVCVKSGRKNKRKFVYPFTAMDFKDD